jgi:hypothetical protein
MPPYFLLSLLLGAIYGTVFHLWRGKSMRDLIIYFVTGILGFWLGQIVGDMLTSTLFLVGPLHLIEATVLSWICLFVVQWLKISA